MLKVGPVVARIKKMHKFVGKNSYAFSRAESELPSPPKSMFTAHLVTVVGGTPLFVVGSVMAASSVLEWSVPLLTASIAVVTAPFVVSNKRRKKYRGELTEGLNAFLPQVVFSEMPRLGVQHVTALDNGHHLEIPLNGGGTVTIKLGREYWMKQPDIAGSILVTPANNGIAEFDLLLKNLSDTNPDVARALNTASNKSAFTQKKADDHMKKAEQKQTIASYLTRKRNLS